MLEKNMIKSAIDKFLLQSPVAPEDARIPHP